MISRRQLVLQLCLLVPALRVVFGSKLTDVDLESSFVFHGRIVFPEGKGFADYQRDRALFLDFDRLRQELTVFSARNAVGTFTTNIYDRHLDYILSFPDQASLDNWVRNVPSVSRFDLRSLSAVGYRHEVIRYGNTQSIFPS